MHVRVIIVCSNTLALDGFVFAIFRHCCNSLLPFPHFVDGGLFDVSTALAMITLLKPLSNTHTETHTPIPDARCCQKSHHQTGHVS